MSDTPVNIAEFRCRAIKLRAGYTFEPSGAAQRGLALVASHARQGGSSRSQRVYDIGVAREAQRTRHRVLFRPMPIQRRAKVLHFHEGEARAAVQMMPRWNPPMNGPYDLPPAA